jgi:MoaA/NifB/PqqE/SkfB family radical SAM enzyme
MDYNAFFSWKTLLYPEKCKAIIDGDFKPPVTLHVYPTNECNNACQFCIMKQERQWNPGYINRSVFEKLMLSANDMGVESLHISGGGEPTLYPHIDAVKLFKGYKVLSTNGRELTPEIANLFDRIRISINAGSAEVYTSINGTEEKDWNQLMDRIRVLSAGKNSYQVGLGFVADAANWKDIPRACEIAEKFGLDFVHIRPAYYPKGTAQEAKVRELAEVIFHASEAASLNYAVPIFSISDKFEGFWTKRQYEKCLASPLHAVVTATGEFVVCQDVFTRFGNLYTDPFEKIWSSPEHKAAIAKIDPDKCPRCVMNRPNEIMENIFVNNKIVKELL